MRPGVSLGRERAFGLAHAVLIYTDGTRSYAALHDPVSVPGSAPTLGPGRMVSTSFLRTLSKQLGESVSPDVLPANVLVRTADVTVWWRSASIETLFYNPAKDAAHAKELVALNGKRVPIPPLVFRATKSQLWVRALGENARPNGATPLYAAPFYNVSATGGVCLGSMRRPQGRGLETLPQWERSFFESEFTHVLPGVVPFNPSTVNKEFTAMWAELAQVVKAMKKHDPVPSFPKHWLASAPKKQVLSAFVVSNVVGRL